MAFFNIVEMSFDGKCRFTIKGWLSNNTFKLWESVIINAFDGPVQLIYLSIDFLCILITFMNVVFLKFCVSNTRFGLYLLVNHVIDLSHMCGKFIVLK